MFNSNITSLRWKTSNVCFISILFSAHSVWEKRTFQLIQCIFHKDFQSICSYKYTQSSQIGKLFEPHDYTITIATSSVLEFSRFFFLLLNVMYQLNALLFAKRICAVSECVIYCVVRLFYNIINARNMHICMCVSLLHSYACIRASPQPVVKFIKLLMHCIIRPWLHTLYIVLSLLFFWSFFRCSQLCGKPYHRDFITDCFKPSPRRPYEIPWEQKAMWAFLFGSMLLIAIIGNCIVIWIVLGKCAVIWAFCFWVLFCFFSRFVSTCHIFPAYIYCVRHFM